MRPMLKFVRNFGFGLGIVLFLPSLVLVQWSPRQPNPISGQVFAIPHESGHIYISVVVYCLLYGSSFLLGSGIISGFILRVIGE